MQPSIRQMNLDGLSRVGVVAFRDFVAQKCLGSLWYGSGKERKRRMECSPTSSGGHICSNANKELKEQKHRHLLFALASST